MSSKDHMASFHAAFRADDTLINIIPSFDCAGNLPMISSLPVGPFKSQVPTMVPLWMGLFLQQRSLATVVPPVWWNIENLVNIIGHEKSKIELFPTGEQLPANYYEISKRLTGTNTHMYEQSDAVQLLIQDLFEIRMDKLRQQFQSLFTQMVDTDLMVLVNGIGTQELAILQAFVTQALQDQHALATNTEINPTPKPVTSAVNNETTTTTNGIVDPNVAPLPPVRRIPLRRFAKPGSHRASLA